MDAKSKPAFTEAEVKAVLQSKEGQQLLQLLQRDGGGTLNRAAKAIQSGEYEKAYEALQPVMRTEKATQLVEEINRKRG